MSDTFTKTVKLRLRTPTNRKEEKIEKFMKKTRDIAREVSNRMMSIPKGRWSIKTHSTWYGIVKDIRQGMSINSEIAQKTVDKVRQSYLSWKNQGYGEDKPRFEAPSWIPYTARSARFFKKNDTFYVSLPFESGRGSREVFPFVRGEYQDYFLKRICKETLDYGSAELVKYDDHYSLNLSIKRPVDLDYEPETFIGVDIGLNQLAWAVARDSDGSFLNEVHFSGKEAGHIRDQYNRKRRELQKEGNLEEVRRLEDKERRWMENKNHTVSRRIVEFAEEFEKPLIILEDINVNKIRERTNNPAIHSWTAGQLRDMIEYKAEEKEIKTKEVPPEYTSQKCPKCGEVSKENRNGVDFDCVGCGYTNHADFVGAWNIANKVF